jgi:L-phenylalanine/L-methionine N-acetyltransferase
MNMNTSDPAVTVRPVREEDAEAVWAISRQEGVMETILSLPSDRFEHRRAVLRELGPDQHWFVAVADDEVVGLAGLEVGRGRLRHSGHVFLFVARDWQGRGVGSQLLQTLLDLADNWLMLRRVELTVFADNERAKRLYERLGFEVEGLRKLSVTSQGELKDEYMMARYR